MMRSHSVRRAGDEGASAGGSSPTKPSPQPSPKGRGSLSIISDRLDRTAGKRFFARGPLGFILRLLTDKGIGVFERAQEVFWRQVTTNVAVNASRIDVEWAGDVLFNFVVRVRHRVRRLRRFHRLDNRSRGGGKIRSFRQAVRALSESTYGNDAGPTRRRWPPAFHRLATEEPRYVSSYSACA